MAEQKSAGFVGKLVEDPANPPQTVHVYGYAGASALEEHTRVYLRADLGHYIDVPDDAVLHQQDVPKGQNSLGAIHLWYRPGAQVAVNGVRPSDAAQSAYLGGGIQQNLLGSQPNTYVMQTNCPPATVCPQPTTLCPPTVGQCSTLGQAAGQVAPQPTPSAMTQCPACGDS